jgi:hypothetical protein
MQAKSTHDCAIRGTTFLKTLQTAPKKPLSSNPLSCRYRIVPGSTVEVGHDRTAQAQQHRASGLALVTAAIVLWNTVYLGRALDAVRRRGDLIPDALLAHLAPLGWQHINLTGDYLWGADASLGPDGFRPLRNAAFNPPTAIAA